jgi:hypothetical protein
MAGKMDSKTRAYSYVRISSKAQIEGRGVARQIEKAREYADKHGLMLDDSLTDIGKSGFHGDHVKFGALGNFLKLVREGQIPVGSFLLVESLDRLSREDVLTAQAQFLHILQAGITVVTLIDGMEYHKDKDFTQLIISLTYMSRANNESAEKSKRIKDAIMKRKQDALDGKPRYNHHLPGWLTQTRVGDSKDFVFGLNAKSKAIQRIFELSDQGIGCWSIARMLNSEGFAVLRESTNVDSKWKEAQVRLLQGNEIVIGTYQPLQTIDGKRVPFGQPVKNYYPAAVDEELFWRVQRNRTKPKPVGRQGRKLSNLFARITSCSGCGRIMRLSQGGTQKSRKYYLSCMQRTLVDGHTCGNKFFPYAPLEEAILTFATDFYEAAAAEMQVPEQNKMKLEKQLSEATARLEQLEKQRKNTLDMSKEDLDHEDKAELLANVRTYRSKIEDQKSYIKQIERELASTRDKRDELKTVMDQVMAERETWKTGTDDEVKQSRAKVSQMLREFITTVEVNVNEETATVWIGGFTSAYKFDRKGNLIGHVNILPMLVPGSAKLYMDRTPSGRIKSIRKLDNAPKQAPMTEQMMIEFMEQMGWKNDRIELALKASRRIVEATG